MAKKMPEESVLEQRAAPERLNIMVVGESGLGKTTCIQTLLNFLEGDKAPLRWKSKKTVKISKVGERLVNKDGPLPSYCHIYDSPGYGDEIDNQKSFDIIREDLHSRHTEYDNLLRTQSSAYNMAELKGKDNRIHCCLYFISPHRMKHIDVEFIRILSRYVVIVPVIAKADTMTTDERNQCLDEVKAAMKAINDELKANLVNENVSRRDQIRATFNFDDRQEIYVSGKEIKAQIPDNTRKVDEEAVPMQTFDYFKLRSFRGGAASDDDDDDDDDDNEEKETEVVERCNEKTGENFSGVDVTGAEQEEIKIERIKEDSDVTADNDATSGVLVDGDTLKIPIYDSSGKLVNRIKRYKNLFAVVADTSLYRQYQWGLCSVENSLHSDFPILKRLLFQPNSISDMIEETRKRTHLLMRKSPDLDGVSEKVGLNTTLHFNKRALLPLFLLLLVFLVMGTPQLFRPQFSQAVVAAGVFLHRLSSESPGTAFTYSIFEEEMPVCLSRDSFDALDNLKEKVLHLRKAHDDCVVNQSHCESSLSFLQEGKGGKLNMCNGRLKTCKEDLQLYQNQEDKYLRRISRAESKNRELEAILTENDAKCFHVSSTINYKGVDYSYDELVAGDEPECFVPHSPFSVGVVISTSCHKTVRTTDTHLIWTSKGFKLAYTLKEGDILYGDFEDTQVCTVTEVKKELSSQQYFGLNCLHSEVLASGIRVSTFGDFHALPSWYMTYVGGLVGPKSASILVDFITECGLRILR